MPVEISDWNDLDNVRNDLTSNYVLVTNLDENTNGYAGIGDDFEPIGDDSGNEFGGEIDGKGYGITEIEITKAQQGMALISSLNGVIKDMFISGSVTGKDPDASFLAILSGLNRNGTISNCFVQGEITEAESRGGLCCGFSDGIVEDSYAIGTINATSGSSRVGGLIGDSGGGSEAVRCYAAFEGNNVDGGIIGRSRDLPGHSNTYWDTEISGVDVSGSDADVGLNTAEMQGSEAETNMDGFDFANVWDSVVESDDDATADRYPVLLALDREQQLDAQGILSLTAFTISALVNSESVEIQDIFAQVDGEVREVTEALALINGSVEQI